MPSSTQREVSIQLHAGPKPKQQNSLQTLQTSDLQGPSCGNSHGDGMRRKPRASWAQGTFLRFCCITYIISSCRGTSFEHLRWYSLVSSLHFPATCTTSFCKCKSRVNKYDSSEAPPLSPRRAPALWGLQNGARTCPPVTVRCLQHGRSTE